MNKIYYGCGCQAYRLRKLVNLVHTQQRLLQNNGPNRMEEKM